MKTVKKFLSLVLVLIMCFSVIPMADLGIEASAFSARTSAPSTSDSRYYSGNVFYTSGYGMPNCTCYAYGRAWEILGKEPKLSHGNAGAWWSYNKNGGYYPYGSTPKLGAIAVWDQYDDNHGHVAVVEAINGNKITISESSWQGYNWRLSTINSDGTGNLNTKTYRFRGYIYITNEEPDKCECSESHKGNYICTANTSLLIRSGHGTSFPSIGSIPSGTKVYVSKASSEWAHVDYNGISGFASMRYLSKEVTHSCTGYNIHLSWNEENGKFYDSNTATVTITPKIDGRDATDSEINSIIIYVQYPDGTLKSGNLGKKKDYEFYIGNGIAGTYTMWAKVDTKYGSSEGSVGDGDVELNLSRVSLSNGSYDDEVTYRRIQFEGIDRYLTVDANGNVVSSERQNNNSSNQSQVWRLVKNSDGTYIIQSVENDNVLDVTKGAYCRGTDVITYTSQGSDNQKWYLSKNSSGEWFIRAAKSNSAVLDVEDADSTNGTNVGLWTYNGGDAQKVDFIFPYRITYNANGGSGAPSNQSKDYNKSVTLSSTKPTRSGYTFLGWSTSSNATSASYSAGSSYSSNADLTLYAVWKEVSTYTLSYNANGGSGAPSSQSGATSYAVSSTVPTRQGYTFLGWSKSSSASTASYKPGSTINLSSNTTLYAVWNPAATIKLDNPYNATIDFASQEYYYTFTPTANGDYTIESWGDLDTKVYVYNSSWTELGNNDDDGDESNFMLKLNLTAGTKYYIKVRAFSLKTGSTSFIITKEAPTTYTLSYNVNGGSGAPSSQSGATSYAISSTVPTRQGYTFLGWSKSSSASSATYKPGSTIELTSNATLYAVWKSASSIYTSTSYSTNVEFADQEYYYTFTPTTSSDYIFESTGSLDTKVYVYNSSWTELGYNDDGGTDSNFKLKINLTSGTKYYIKVRAYSSKVGSTSFSVTKEAPTTYTLTYNANNGGNAPSSQSGATSYIISSSIPTRLGHAFLGWSTSSSASSATYKPGQTINLSSNTTLYAVWKSTVAVSEDYEVDVKFDFANQDHYYSFTPTTSGEYSFISISAHFNTKMYIYNSSWTQLDFKNGFDYSCELTVNLTAGNKYYVRLSGTNLSTGYAVFGVIRYVPDTYTLTYNANGGTNAPSTQTGETSYQISPIIPRRTGYTFVGWSTNSNATSPTYKPWQTINLSSNITLYAVWEKNHEHSYTSVTTNPDCVNPGSIKYTCTCGESYSETIPALGHRFNGDSEQCQLCGYDRTENCGCNCHKGGIAGFFFKIILFFQKLFKTNKVCACGMVHY